MPILRQFLKQGQRGRGCGDLSLNPLLFTVKAGTNQFANLATGMKQIRNTQMIALALSASCCGAGCHALNFIATTQ